MFLTHKKLTLSFRYETNYRFEALKSLRKALLQYGAAPREAIAQIVKGHGFDAHTGGHHVAIIQDNVRLAIVTSSHPDFN